jgi:hypothetical protein
MSRRDHRAVQSNLIILMQHIIKWQTQPLMRSKSWSASIANSRRSIAFIREDMPSITDVVLTSYWERCFQAACKAAEKEMRVASGVENLTWHEVFEKDYQLHQ